MEGHGMANAAAAFLQLVQQPQLRGAAASASASIDSSARCAADGPGGPHAQGHGLRTRFCGTGLRVRRPRVIGGARLAPEWGWEPPAPPPASFIPAAGSAAGPSGPTETLAPPPPPARIPTADERAAAAAVTVLRSPRRAARRPRDAPAAEEEPTGARDDDEEDEEEEPGGEPRRRWRERYEELRAFVEEHGHARVPRSHGALAHWCLWQRLRRDDLSPEKKALLDAVGFAWNLRGDKWEAMYEDAKAVKEALKVERLRPSELGSSAAAALEAAGGGRRGAARAAAAAARAGALRAWIYRQRIQHRGGRLSAEQEAKLEALGCLDSEDEAEGAARGPGRPRKGAGAGRARQAAAARPSQADVLRFGSRWEGFYAALAEMRARHGHCNPHSSRDGDPRGELAAWADRQRALRRRGALAPHLVRRLEQIDFGWSRNEARWRENFARLAAFKEEHGHCSVPQRWPRDPALARLVSNLRTWRKSGLLAPERQAELDAIGFEWGVYAAEEAAPASLVRRLQEYRRRHGSANVLRPPTAAAAADPELPALRQFAYRMARRWREGALPPAQLKALGRLGLLDAFAQIRRHASRRSWADYYEELKALREQQGHCKVPRKANALYVWAHKQRRYAALGALPASQRAALEALGFEWGGPSSWDARFAQLCAFADAAGHCRVPPEEAALYKWAAYNRARRRAGRLPEDKVRALEALGFPWEPERARAEAEEEARAGAEEERAAAAERAAAEEEEEEEEEADVAAIEAALESATRELEREAGIQPAASPPSPSSGPRYAVPEFRPPFDDSLEIPADRLPYSFEEALWHAFKSVRAAARASFLRNSVEISLPQEDPDDKHPLLRAAREMTYHFARESQLFAGPKIRGRTVKVFFSDAGSAALARREWGEYLGDLPYKICFFRTGGIGDAVDRGDEAVIVVGPYPPEFENVARIAMQAQALVRPFVLLNHNLTRGPQGQRPTGVQARATAQFLETMQTSYCLKHFHSGIIVFRSFPSNWQVVSVSEANPEEYSVVKEMVNRPTRADITLALQELLGTERYAAFEGAGGAGREEEGPGVAPRSAWDRFAAFVSRVTGLDVFQ